MNKGHRIAPDVKQQILARIKNEGVSVSQAAKDHGVHDSTIYGWLGASATSTPSLKEYLDLKKENEQLLNIVGKLTLDKLLTQKKS
jgi:transposase-like protein